MGKRVEEHLENLQKCDNSLYMMQNQPDNDASLSEAYKARHAKLKIAIDKANDEHFDIMKEIISERRGIDKERSTIQVEFKHPFDPTCSQKCYVTGRLNDPVSDLVFLFRRKIKPSNSCYSRRRHNRCLHP